MVCRDRSVILLGLVSCKNATTPELMKPHNILMLAAEPGDYICLSDKSCLGPPQNIENEELTDMESSVF